MVDDPKENGSEHFSCISQKIPHDSFFLEKLQVLGFNVALVSRHSSSSLTFPRNFLMFYSLFDSAVMFFYDQFYGPFYNHVYRIK